MNFKDYEEHVGCEASVDPDMIDDIRQLAEIVCYKHYSYVDYHKRQDLISEGILKAVELICQGDFSPDRGALKNYLYTGMRNQMQNYLYGSKREFPVEEFFNQESNLQVGQFIISIKDIENFLSGFLRDKSGYLPQVVSILFEMGFEFDRSVEMKEPLEEMEGKRVERLVVLFLWENQAYFL